MLNLCILFAWCWAIGEFISYVLEERDSIIKYNK